MYQGCSDLAPLPFLVEGGLKSVFKDRDSSVHGVPLCATVFGKCGRRTFEVSLVLFYFGIQSRTHHDGLEKSIVFHSG